MDPSKSDGSPGKTAVAPQRELCLDGKHSAKYKLLGRFHVRFWSSASNNSLFGPADYVAITFFSVFLGFVASCCRSSSCSH